MSNKAHKNKMMLKWKQYDEEGHKLPIEGINGVVDSLEKKFLPWGELKDSLRLGGQCLAPMRILH